MTIKKRILRSKSLRPVLNRIYKDSDVHEVKMCMDPISMKRYIDRKRRKEDTNKYYFS